MMMVMQIALFVEPIDARPNLPVPASPNNTNTRWLESDMKDWKASINVNTVPLLAFAFAFTVLDSGDVGCGDDC